MSNFGVLPINPEDLKKFYDQDGAISPEKLAGLIRDFVVIDRSCHEVNLKQLKIKSVEEFIEAGLKDGVFGRSNGTKGYAERYIEKIQAQQ